MTMVETERLRLRVFREDDVSNVMKIFSDPVAMQFFHGVRDEKGALDDIQRWQEHQREYGHGLWATELKETGEFVGRIGLIRQIDVDGVDETEVGYSLVRAHWGKGYATEAAIGCRDYAMYTLGCKRVISLIAPDNTASINVAKRNGFTFEKTVMRWDQEVCVYVGYRED